MLKFNCEEYHSSLCGNRVNASLSASPNKIPSKERFNKKISFDFPKNINRWDLIKRIIKEKKFNGI